MVKRQPSLSEALTGLGTCGELMEKPYKKTYSCGTEPHPGEVILERENKPGPMRLIGQGHFC